MATSKLDPAARADQRVLAAGLAPTRSAAQRLIDRGGVAWLSPKGWVTLRKTGEQLPQGCELKVIDDAETRWVSRSGLKLEGALAKLADLSLTGKVVLDVGQSTGGFTEVMLAQGAARVVGVEVGHSQLHERLRADERVRLFEGLNARHLEASALGDAFPEGGFDLIVGDLSFISLTLVLPALVPLLAPQGELLMLVKPQFELQPEHIGKGGLVKDPASYKDVQRRMRQACASLNMNLTDYFDSPVSGGDGNREFFFRARLAADEG